MSKASQRDESYFNQGFIDGKNARSHGLYFFGRVSIRNIKNNPFYRYKRAPKGYGKGFYKGFNGQLKRD